MKIFKSEVIQNNLPLIMSFVKDIRAGDDADILEKRVGQLITVNPEGSDPAIGEAEQVQVAFKTDTLIAVSKYADSEKVVSLLNQALGSLGSLASVGTGPTGGGNQAVGGLGEASITTIANIAHTEQTQNTFPIHVPVHEPAVVSPHVPWNVELTGHVSGWTVTTDTGANETADISFLVRLNTQDGNKIETTNEGEKTQKPIKSDASTAMTLTSSPLMNGYMQVDYKLQTDGYLWFATVSLVHIKEIVLDFAYKP